MAIFKDLDEDDDIDIPRSQQIISGIKPVWNETLSPQTTLSQGGVSSDTEDREEAHEPAVEEQPPIVWNSMTAALGCYPVVMALVANIDLNTLDSLSRTCRGVRAGLLQSRTMVLRSTLHCSNEALPIDPEQTLRYRARAGNVYYMEDTGRPDNYNGKFGHCARDMVSECRKCGTVVCRNCVIKPPAPVVQRDRHRRLCRTCQKAPIGSLVKPRQSPDMTVDAGVIQRAVCTCASDAVWLCQPCGRSIRSQDSEYRGIWKWRHQYGEVLGGLGTGIGDADRGVECGRKGDCLSSKHIEHETDCDAEDAREAEDLEAQTTSGTGTPTLSLYSGCHSWASHSSLSLHSSTSLSGLPEAVAVAAGVRTPSPSVGPGYARHEIEGIGGGIKTKRLRMVRVGGCVPEWEDERTTGRILNREIGGQVRSWCDWCSRVVPGKKDYEMADKQGQAS